MHYGACRGKRCRSRIRANEAQHLMAALDEFFNHGRADEAGCTGNKNTDVHFSFFWPARFTYLEILTSRHYFVWPGYSVGNRIPQSTAPHSR
jgi:hypothetical protein